MEGLWCIMSSFASTLFLIEYLVQWVNLTAHLKISSTIKPKCINRIPYTLYCENIKQIIQNRYYKIIINKSALETFVLSEKYMLCECSKLYLIILFINLYVFRVFLLTARDVDVSSNHSISYEASLHYYLHNTTVTCFLIHPKLLLLMVVHFWFYGQTQRKITV